MKDIIQGEVLDSIIKNGYNGVVLGATGIGKAKIMVDVLKLLKPETTLYGCDNTELRDKTFLDEMLKWDGEEYIDKVDRQCYQTIYKWKDKEYDLFLADEADFFITPKYFEVLKNNKFKHILLFTGTMTDEKRNIISNYLSIIHEVKIAEAEERGAVNKIKVYFVNYNLTAIENAQYLSFNEQFKKLLSGNRRLNNQEKFRLKVIQRQRNLFFRRLNSSHFATRELLKKLYNNHKNKILIFCGLTEEADRICRYSYHGKSTDPTLLEKFNNWEIRVLSVVDKIDRGVNLNEVNCIIFKSPSKSKTKIGQRSGRARRLQKDKISHCFFMIPYYKTRRGELKPTIIHDYVWTGASDLDLGNATILNINI